jgi:aromatic-L-amino-acid decarboxylase
MTDGVRSPFDPSLFQMRAMGSEVVDFVSRFVDDRYGAVTSDYSDLEPLLTELAAPPPREGGAALQPLLETIGRAATKGFDPANPGFCAYIPGGGLYAAALADFIACALNRYTGISLPAPAMVQMESSVLRWLCDLFDLPPTSQGVLTPGGSMANLSGIVAARSSRLGERFLDGTIYVSDEVHHSIAKAARIAGFPAGAVRTVATDDDLRLNPDSLRQAVTADLRRGRRPFMVVASAGTITTGVVDSLADVADVAQEHGLWLHVDGAYGGFFQLTSRGRAAFRGVERADSITLDPHKGMFLPYGTGCLLARDGAALREAHELQAHYLPPPSADPGLPDFASYSPELTRDFRGLRMWLPLHLHGVDLFEDALDEKLDLASYVHACLTEMPDLDLPWRPELSLVAFKPRDGRLDAEDLLARINGSGRVWLSSAPVRGDTYLRMCILSHRSRGERMREAVDIIARALA